MNRATRLYPEYTLWAEQQASGTCSVAGQIKALSLQHWQGLFWVPSPKKLHSAIYPLFTTLSSSVTHDFTGVAHDFTGQPCAAEQKASVTKLKRQKTAQARQMRLLWVAVFHYSSECIAIILVVGWWAACWSHLREGPVACQRSWSEWEGNNVYCYIFCFLSLYLYLFTAASIFCIFYVQSLLSFPCTVHYKYLFISAIYSLSFPGRMASFSRYCMSFATSLYQSDQ